jgi:rhodanese-related sulfurtransferase
LARFSLEDPEEAQRLLAEASQQNPDDERILIPLAASYGMLLREEEGRRAVNRLNELRKLENKRLVRSGLTPGIDLFLLGSLTLQDLDLWPFKEQPDRERLREGLLRVGVPERGKDDAESPRVVPGAMAIDVREARNLFDRGVHFVDVRGPSWNLGHIPGATHLFLKDHLNESSLSATVEKHEQVVFYCMGPGCLLSSGASALAVSWGYEKVYYFRDGFPAWQAAGHPVQISD